MADKKKPKQKTPRSNEIPAWKRREASRDLKRAARGNDRASRPVRQPQKH